MVKAEAEISIKVGVRSAASAAGANLPSRSAPASY